MNHLYRSLVLSAIYQCADLVHNIALKGSAKFADYETLTDLLTSEGDQLAGLLKDKQQQGALKTGLEQLVNQLSGQERRIEHLEVTRYVVGILALERTVTAHVNLEQLADSVNACFRKEGEIIDQNSHIDDQVSCLAALYTQHISSLQPRIRIKGARGHLTARNNAARIRAILLIGVRLAIAYRQGGGRRWHLFVFRRRYINQAYQCLQQKG